jgi:CRISPR-associated protein Cmr6
MAEPPKLKPGRSPGNPRSNSSPENAKQSPLWLKGYEPSIATDKDTFVSFVEYLRWMRSHNTSEKDKTKLEILQLAAEKAKSYKQRLEVLTSRTKKIAGAENTFEVKSTWRIRVGGQRGPESMLLPAWDALGIPYIPSSTLRGVARDRAIREFMAEEMSSEGLSSEEAYKKATEAIAPFFGSIDASTPTEDRSGKVIFLDAYPIPSDGAVLAVDIANNIWKWKDGSPKYGASPQSFLSLKKPTFEIGIKPTQKCDRAVFNRIKDWLIAGLQAGIGSQVNSGYGELLEAGVNNNTQPEIMRTNFILEGQLIHGVQKIIPGEKYPQPQSEVRPIAFRSMLRYWFRAFALGVLQNDEVRDLEAKLFGSIEPTLSNPKKPTHGWVSLHILEKDCKPSTPDVSGKQLGTLILRYSNSAPANCSDSIYKLCRNLTWLCFNLGGVGQGARRPLHQRSSFPRCRGSKLQLAKEDFESMSFKSTFTQLFPKSLQDFYDALSELLVKTIEARSQDELELTENSKWVEAVDVNCKVFICRGDRATGKPFALRILHSQPKVQRQGETIYNPDLCGCVGKKKLDLITTPSPVWISGTDDYQVVTVFGANAATRKKYIEALYANKEFETIQVFPLQ